MATRVRIKKKSALVLNEEEQWTEKKPDVGVLSHVTFNLASARTRRDTFEGRSYLVTPMVMLVEGVHNGSRGKGYYPEEELSKHPEAWNHKPIVLYHPTINGVGVPACDPEILEARKLGLIFNTSYKGRLKSEAWLEIERMEKLAPKVLKRIKKGEVVELSTGLFMDREYTENGEWKGEEYDWIGRNFRPDHLAILPDQEGACSVKDGAGLCRNEVSNDAVRMLLHTALKEENGDNYYCYIEDVFSRYFVYSMGGKMYRQNYTTTDTQATLVGEPEEVVKHVRYLKPDGSVVANVNKESVDMKKSEMVEKLITSNTGWEESDREHLLKMSEKKLESFLANIREEQESEDEEPEERLKVKVKKIELDPIPTGNQQQEPPKPKEMSEQEFIANAPPRIREMIANSLRITQAQKDKVIAVITANARNKFTAEQLKAKTLEELQNIASLIAPEQEEQTVENWAGMLDAAPPTTNDEKVQGLPLPSMNFERDWAKK